jgi:hypothetical protein
VVSRGCAIVLRHSLLEAFGHRKASYVGDFRSNGLDLRVLDAAVAERLTTTPSRLPSPEPVATVRSSIEPLWNEWYEA